MPVEDLAKCVYTPLEKVEGKTVSELVEEVKIRRNKKQTDKESLPPRSRVVLNWGSAERCEKIRNE